MKPKYCKLVYNSLIYQGINRTLCKKIKVCVIKLVGKLYIQVGRLKNVRKTNIYKLAALRMRSWKNNCN